MPIFRWTHKEEKTDQQLLEEFRRSKDPEVAGALYAKYMHLVYGVCLKYLYDREEAKDSVMQIFEKILTEIPRHDIQNFKSWLYVLTKNFCLMKLRTQKSRDKSREKYVKEEISFMESSTEMHPIDGEGNGLDQALRECIGRLKSEQKECIELFYYKSKCYAEIARSLNLDEKKVKSHLQNGKRNLKICLEGKNVGQEKI